MHQEQTTLTLVHFDQNTKSRQIRLSCCVFLVLQSGLPPGHLGEVWVHLECTVLSHPLPCTDRHPAIHQAGIYMSMWGKQNTLLLHTTTAKTNTSYQQRWNKHIIPVKVKQTFHTSEGETNSSYQRRWNKHFIPAEVKQTHHTSRNKMSSSRVKQTRHTNRDKTTSPRVTQAHHSSRDKTTSPRVKHHTTNGETNTYQQV